MVSSYYLADYASERSLYAIFISDFASLIADSELEELETISY